MNTPGQPLHKSLYDILEVERHCTCDDIASAWTEKKRKLPLSSPEYKITERAYVTLHDPLKRELYNKFQIIEDDADDFNNQYFFSESFLEKNCVKEYKNKLSSKQTDSKQPRPVAVSLEDLYIGRQLNINVETMSPCSSCKGRVNTTDCPQCKKYLGRALTMCPSCHGMGYLPAPNNCKVCNGKNSIQVFIPTQIDIKRGMKHGEKVKTFYPLQGVNVTCMMTLKQTKHRTFTRQGNDLYLKKKISLTEALCGCHFVVAHLDNRKLFVSSPAGSVLPPGCKKVIKGGGMPLRHANGEKFGDLIILFSVSFPGNLDHDVQNNIEALLPSRPIFNMPENPETEEYHFTDFDPSYKLLNTKQKEAYYDEKYDKKHEFERKKQCTHQ